MRDDVLLIHEIYASIQGESSFAGLPCTFVRTTGCNLRCSWCDTTQAFHGGQKLARAEVLQRALAMNTPLVELTGGEPLLQAGVPPLLRELCDAGKTVLIETSGERDISVVDPRVHRIVDVKAPGSGEHARNRYQNFELLTQNDELK
ncbi:MAG TPA: radical SAM protein, partial [Polyangiales bacterium]